MPYYLEDQLFDPAARQEAYSAVQNLREGHLIELITAQKGEAEEDTKEWRARTDEWWDLWENRVDFTAKEDWQAQVWVNKPFAATEQATALIQRAVVDSPDFWGMTGHDDRDTLLAENLWKPFLTNVLKEAHFAEKYVDATKTGFICGVAGYLKPRLQVSMVPTLSGVALGPTGLPVPQYTQRAKSFLTVDWVDPRHTYRDPDSLSRENFSGSYFYHAEWKTRPFLQSMAKAGWIEDAVAEVLRSSTRAGKGSQTATDSDRARQQKMAESSKFRTNYLVNEGWCDILDENGDVVFPNALLIETGGKIVYLNENPLWATDLGTGRRKWPFIGGSPIPHPKKFTGRGLIEQDADLAWLYSNTFMLMADGMNWLVNGESEVFKDALEDWEDLERYPGKLWVKKIKEQAFMRTQSGGLDLQASLGFLQFVDQIRQNSNFVTDFAVGLPGTRSDITKGEVQIKTAQSLAVFEAMGRNLELPGRECIELLYQMAVQFIMTDDQDPSLARILGTRNALLLSRAPIQQRLEMVQGNFDFTFTGVSQALQKANLLQSLTQFGALAAQPPYLQLLLQQPKVFMDIIKANVQLLGLGDRIEVQTEMAPMAGPMAAISPAVIQMLMQGGAGSAAEPASFGPMLGPMAGPGMQPGFASQPEAAGIAG